MSKMSRPHSNLPKSNLVPQATNRELVFPALQKWRKLDTMCLKRCLVLSTSFKNSWPRPHSLWDLTFPNQGSNLPLLLWKAESNHWTTRVRSHICSFHGPCVDIPQKSPLNLKPEETCLISNSVSWHPETQLLTQGQWLLDCQVSLAQDLLGMWE